MAKLLYVSKRVILDISPTTAILCTKVSKNIEQDWLKLRPLLEYINCTMSLRNVIKTNGLDNMMTYVDAAYANHADMAGHTGGLVSLGKGTIHTKWSKPKLNTKRSTESEINGAIDYIAWGVWLKRMLES